ncbi:hypothetical protein LguiB_004552 [Lonicera macranthoides]
MSEESTEQRRIAELGQINNPIKDDLNLIGNRDKIIEGVIILFSTRRTVMSPELQIHRAFGFDYGFVFFKSRAYQYSTKEKMRSQIAQEDPIPVDLPSTMKRKKYQRKSTMWEPTNIIIFSSSHSQIGSYITNFRPPLFLDVKQLSSEVRPRLFLRYFRPITFTLLRFHRSFGCSFTCAIKGNVPEALSTRALARAN